MGFFLPTGIEVNFTLVGCHAIGGRSTLILNSSSPLNAQRCPLNHHKGDFMETSSAFLALRTGRPTARNGLGHAGTGVTRYICHGNAA